MLHRFFLGLLELLSPSRCAACESILDRVTPGFCAACEPLIEPALPSQLGPDDYVACQYGGPLADAVHRLKYGRALHHAPALASQLTAMALALAGQIDVVTAVPLAPARLRSRGFNQSALLARPIARALDVPFRPRWVRRVRSVGPQVGSDRASRAARVQGVFTASAELRGLRVLLVDDVRTTGSTLDAVRTTLLDAGAARVVTLALAHAPLESA